jgi:hypothetical protein
MNPEKHKKMAIPEEPKPRIEKKWEEKAHKWISAKGQVLHKKVIGLAILKELEMPDHKHSISLKEESLRKLIKKRSRLLRGSTHEIAFNQWGTWICNKQANIRINRKLNFGRLKNAI